MSADEVGHDRFMENLFAGIWLLTASVWVVIGTQMQRSLANERSRDVKAEAMEALSVAKDLEREVPWWRWLARRERRSQINTLLEADPSLLREVRRHQRDAKAWNYLESAAALVFGATTFQFLAEMLD